MATATQRTNFRLDLGLNDDETVFTDTEVNNIFTRAGAKYSNTDVKEAYARVIGVVQLRNKTANQVDYKANDSDEKLSQIFKNLDRMKKDFQADLDVALKTSLPKMRVAVPKRKPKRTIELPDA